MRNYVLFVVGLSFFHSGWAEVATYEEAEKICLEGNPKYTSPKDDGANTFTTDDRFNVAYRYETINVVCSLGRKSGEIEQLKVGQRVLTKEDLKAADQAKIKSQELGDRIAAGNYQDFLKSRKNAVADKFKDPDSVKFRGLYFSNRKGMPTLCGEVNAKNSYGAYVGYRGFYANTGGVQIETVDGRGDGFVYANSANDFCATKFAEIE